MAINYEQEILDILRSLSDEQKQQALNYLRVLKRPQGTPGKQFIEQTKHIRISDEDAAEIITAIEEACEVIDDEPEVDFDG